MTQVSSPVDALPRTSESFDVYGFKFTISGPSDVALSGAWQDFAYFKSEPGADCTSIELIDEIPDYDSVPQVVASVYTPRNVVFKQGHMSFIDYQGRGLAIHDSESDTFSIQSPDPDLRYEAVYLFLLSQIGAYLDSTGLHRVHALAVSIKGRAVLVLLPGGGGKSTLTLELLKHPEVQFLSDDSPFIDRSGHIHAFPLRIGLLLGGEKNIPEEQYRVIERMEFEPKVLLNYEYFAHRVASGAKPGLVLLGSRTMSREGGVYPASFWSGMRAMVANCVVGVGLFQGLEFILNSSPWEIMSRFGLVVSRSRNSLKLIRRSKTYQLRLGRSSESNARAVKECVYKLISTT